MQYVRNSCCQKISIGAITCESGGRINTRDHRGCGVEQGEKIRGPEFFWSALMGALYKF